MSLEKSDRNLIVVILVCNKSKIAEVHPHVIAAAFVGVGVGVGVGGGGGGGIVEGGGFGVGVCSESVYRFANQSIMFISRVCKRRFAFDIEVDVLRPTVGCPLSKKHYDNDSNENHP